MLLVWWCHIVAFTSTSNATKNSMDLQTSSTFFRPYYYNRRPSYPQRYPANYNRPNGNNQRPNYYPAASQTTTIRPTYYPVGTYWTKKSDEQIRAEVAAYTAGHFCNSAAAAAAASSQGPPGICWDSSNQKLRTSSNLTIEDFVIFYARMDYSYMSENIRFRDEICEQSRRFNNVGLICVPYKRISYSSAESESDVECPENARKNGGSVCITGGNCICYLEQYQKIVSEQRTRYYSSLYFLPPIDSPQEYYDL